MYLLPLNQYLLTRETLEQRLGESILTVFKLPAESLLFNSEVESIKV